MKPVKTNVAKLVDKKQPKLSRKINRILQEASIKVAQKVKTLYAKKLNKADDINSLSEDDRQSIQAILDELELDGISIDIVDSITPEIIRAYKQAGILGVEQVGINVDSDMTDLLDKGALDYAELRAGELIKDLTDTTLDELRDIISQALEDGLSPDELSDAIEEMGVFGASRSDMIARTELAFAHVKGNVDGWRETGLVEGKRSILGDNHEIDDECDECVDAGVVPLDDEFIPGYDFPPYHPNCVCDVLPVLINENSDQTDNLDEADIEE